MQCLNHLKAEYERRGCPLQGLVGGDAVFSNTTQPPLPIYGTIAVFHQIHGFDLFHYPKSGMKLVMLIKAYWPLITLALITISAVRPANVWSGRFL